LKRKPLSKRQRQCARLLAEGFTTKEIAFQLGLRPRTVNYHLVQARERMSSATFEQMIFKMCQEFEIPIDEKEVHKDIDRYKEALVLHSSN